MRRASFKFIGAQSYGASFSVDGQRTNGGIFGSVTASQPSLEAVGDLNVMSNAFSAEYAGIANIRVTTKRGGADYHGSIFYNNKNSALSAWTLADKDTLFNYRAHLRSAHLQQAPLQYHRFRRLRWRSYSQGEEHLVLRGL